MPKGSWKPPEAGNAPQAIKDILKTVYSSYRDKHGGENPAVKARGAKIAWTAVKNAGWHKDKDDKWIKSKEMADVEAKDFTIFKTGHWNGETFTENDLDNMVRNYNTEEPIPIIIGHGSDYKGHTRIPAFGQILGGLKRVGSELIAQGAIFNEKLASWIRNGFYNQRSIELTKDNKRILAVGMLGAIPPAVKGLPAMDEALNEIALEYSEDIEGAKIIEFADSQQIEMTSFDEMEELAVNDTFKNVSEYCARFLEDIEELLLREHNHDKLIQKVYELQNGIIGELCLHSKFIEKIDQITEAQENEMADKRSGWKEFFQRVKQLITKHKESEMDLKKEQEYQAKIAEQDTKLKEFAEKEQLANEAKEKETKEFAEKEKLAAEAKAKTDKELADAALLAKDEVLKTEVKVFCEQAIKDNKMTPAMREIDEPIMFMLAKTNQDALKSFQEKYNGTVVPLGTVTDIDVNQSNDKRPLIVQSAEKYAKANPKEFSGLSAEDATNRALYLHSQGKIKFEDTNKQSKGAK